LDNPNSKDDKKMSDETKDIETRHSLYSAVFVDDHVRDGMILFRAPTVLDNSGTHKRLPEEIAFEHIQEGDSLIVMQINERSSGLRTLDSLRFIDVVRKEGSDAFEVLINDIVPPGSSGKIVFDRMADMLGKPHAEE
jgi:hypothetical protein